jgi:hypothetical protein
MFPPGTPVWYNFQNESNNKNIMRAYEGVVRSMSFNNTTGRRTVYEVLRNKSVPENVLVDLVDENNIAYGSQCPVLVNMIAADTSFKEMNGEIISPCFTSNGEAGTSTVTYMVKLMTNDGEIIIEEKVSPDRVRYRFGLDCLRSKINENSSSTTSIGIRTSSVGLPLRRNRRKYEQHQIEERGIFEYLSFDETKRLNPENRFQINKETHAQTKSALPEIRRLCTNEKCNFHAQDRCGGYCYAHYQRLYVQRPKRSEFSGTSCKSERIERINVGKFVVPSGDEIESAGREKSSKSTRSDRRPSPTLH